MSSIAMSVVFFHALATLAVLGIFAAEHVRLALGAHERRELTQSRENLRATRSPAVPTLQAASSAPEADVQISRAA